MNSKKKQKIPLGKNRQTAIAAAICGLLALSANNLHAENLANAHDEKVDVHTQKEFFFDVPAQDLVSALATFSLQSAGAYKIEVDPDLLIGRKSSHLKGKYPSDRAIEVLVYGSGLKALRISQNQFKLVAHNQDSEVSAISSDNVLQQVTVTGTNLATDLQVYPGSVAIVPTSELERTSTVIESLTNIPGVSTGGDAGRGHGQSFMVRGFNSAQERVIVLQNGVRRSTSLYSGMISSARSDNDLLKRVEVVKGASSVQHGSGAIGGVVSMETKGAKDFLAEGQEIGGAAKVLYEQNNRREGYLAAAFVPKDKPFEFLVYGKKGATGDLKQTRSTDGIIKSDGVVDNDEDLSVLFVEGVIKPSNDQRLSLSVYDYSLDTITTWQTISNFDYLDQDDGGPVYGKLRQQDVVAKYSFRPESNPWIDFSASLYHSRANYDRGYDYENNPNANKLDYDNKETRNGLRLSNESHFATGSISHRLVTGLDYERRREDANYVLNDVPTVFGSMPNTWNDLGMYAHLESSLFSDRLKVQAGGRYDRFDRSVSAGAGNFKDTHFSPRIGASFELFNGFNLLGNWSEAFRAPTPHETSSEGPLNRMYWYIPNPDLRPETVRETEIGASWTRNDVFSSGDSLRSKFMYFNGRVKDMITVVGIRPGETPPGGFSRAYGTYANVESVKRHGIELQVDYQGKRGGVAASYSTLRQTDEATGKNTPRAFADKFTLHGNFMASPNLKLGANATHWFKPKQNPATTTTTVNGKPTTVWYTRKSFTVVDAFAQWQPRINAIGPFGRDLTLRLGVNNLFNSDYMSANAVEYSPLTGKGRNIYIQMQTKF